jgi:nucleotide-binding universal stress UspA family protein
MQPPSRLMRRGKKIRVQTKQGMLMKVLLATDGSEHSEAAVDEIVNRYFPANTEVRVISVVEVPSFPVVVPWAGVDLFDQSEKTASEVVRPAVEKVADKLRESDESGKLNVTTKVLFGSPKLAILEEAESFGADLIVVGSHGNGAIERFLLGSVSQAVALHANCSVEIVRSPKTHSSERK